MEVDVFVFVIGEEGVRVGVKSRRRFMRWVGSDEVERRGSGVAALCVVGGGERCLGLEMGVVGRGCGCGCGRGWGVDFLRGEVCDGSGVGNGGEGDRWCLLGVVGGERRVSCSLLER